MLVGLMPISSLRNCEATAEPPEGPIIRSRLLAASRYLGICCNWNIGNSPGTMLSGRMQARISRQSLAFWPIRACCWGVNLLESVPALPGVLDLAGELPVLPAAAFA